MNSVVHKSPFNTKVDEEVISAIKALDYAQFVDIGGTDHLNLNYTANKISMKDEVLESPFFCAVAKGDIKMLNLVLLNKSVDIHIESGGINAFWLACLLGHGHIMKVLAEAGIDIFNTNSSKINVLHLAVIKHYT